VFLAVALNQAPTTTASVTFTTAPGTATSPADYLDRTVTLTFPPKARVRYALVYLTPDTGAEATQSFTVNLSAPSGLTIGDGTGTVTLLDDD
jgi:chitinase